jgi:alkylation response protein AidB-like acyl-CoA dehydrogenase
MAKLDQITSPGSESLVRLCDELVSRSSELDASGAWPAEQLRMLGEAGVYRWFLPREWGGFDWSEAELARGYTRLAAACLTTTFVLTQRSAAVRRIVECDNEIAKERLLSDLASGDKFATVGISHLTTSRRHLARPVLAARETRDGFVLDGYSPWVTGADHADTVVLGATLDDGRQILVALSTSQPGVTVPAQASLLGLTASHTGPLECCGVEISQEWLLDGPLENVIAARSGARTGGLQTSALAIGLAAAAINFLKQESGHRSDLAEPAENLHGEQQALEADLIALASGVAACSSDELRARANSLALRSAQAALAAAKGAGYVSGHPAGRWCREALFFLVWSCPQPVMNANLCELAGLSD